MKSDEKALFEMKRDEKALSDEELKSTCSLSTKLLRKSSLSSGCLLIIYG